MQVLNYSIMSNIAKHNLKFYTTDISRSISVVSNVTNVVHESRMYVFHLISRVQIVASLLCIYPHCLKQGQPRCLKPLS